MIRKTWIILILLFLTIDIYADLPAEEVIYVYKTFRNRLEDYQPSDPKKIELLGKLFPNEDKESIERTARSFYYDPIYSIKPREYAGKIIIRGEDLTTECMDPKLSQDLKDTYAALLEQGVPFEKVDRNAEKPKQKYTDEVIEQAGEADRMFDKFVRWTIRKTYKKDEKEFFSIAKKMLLPTFDLVEINPRVGKKLIGNTCQIWNYNRKIYAAMQPYNVTESSLWVIELENKKTNKPEYFYYQNIPYFNKKYDFKPMKDILKDKNLALDDRIEPFDINKIKIISDEENEAYYKSRGLEVPEIPKLPEMDLFVPPIPKETFAPVNVPSEIYEK